jgi:hypothetical protein
VPSVVSSYSLTLTHPRGQIFHSDRVNVSSNGFEITSGSSTQTLDAPDALDRKTSVPIPQGGLAQGFLLFVFKGIDLKLIQVAGVTNLRCIDGWRRPKLVSNKIAGLPIRHAFLRCLECAS